MSLRTIQNKPPHQLKVLVAKCFSCQLFSLLSSESGIWNPLIHMIPTEVDRQTVTNGQTLRHVLLHTVPPDQSGFYVLAYM